MAEGQNRQFKRGPVRLEGSHPVSFSHPARCVSWALWQPPADPAQPLGGFLSALRQPLPNLARLPGHCMPAKPLGPLAASAGPTQLPGSSAATAGPSSCLWSFRASFPPLQLPLGLSHIPAPPPTILGFCWGEGGLIPCPVYFLKCVRFFCKPG